MKVIALIPAAGAGVRMDNDVRKQYLKLGGKPILVHTLSRFEQCSRVDEIVLIVPSGEVEYCKKNIINHYHFQKVKKVIPGGKRRQDSVWRGIETIDFCDIVIIHDGVRPFITTSLIEETIWQVKDYGAVIVGVPAKETTKIVSSQAEVVETLKREMIWIIQTPQTFKYNVLKEAYQRAYQDGFYGTDDASLVERLRIKVKIIEGSYSNIKITTLEDLVMGENILRSMMH
jgi:2-C-methyl-D-erythritol 4-phosphate cytidylyltransferase